jgi:hypothetical protein
MEISSVWYDHYFGDAPAQLRAHGYQTGWLPSVSHESDQIVQWDDVTQTQAIPDASPWMVLTGSEVWQIAWHRLKWAVIYVYLFVWREIQSELTYEGISFGRPFKDAYKNVYRFGGWTDVFIDIERYRHACRSLEPEAVLYRDEFYSSGRRLAAGAKDHTRLVGVQHGMISREHTVYQWSKDDIREATSEGLLDQDHVLHVPAPDWFAAFGEHYVEQFADWGGYPASQVVPVGGLRHNILVDQYDLCRNDEAREVQRYALREAYNLPPGRPVILLATAEKQTAGAWFEMVVDGLEQQSLDAFIAVKLHQYHGGEENVRQASVRHSFDAYEIYTEDIYPLMAASDVLIGGGSTTILEGNLFGLQCIAICASETYQPYPFSRDDLASVVTDSEDIGKALRDIMVEKGSTNKFIEDHLNNKDGNSLRRLSQLLDSITDDEVRTSTLFDC